MNATKLWALCLIAAFNAGSDSAFAKPGDSVDSGRLIRRSGQAITEGQGAMSFFPVFENVPLGSQTGANYFVQYGPFKNISAAALRIRLIRTGRAPHSGLYGRYGTKGQVDNAEMIDFVVDPSVEFYFGAKDYALISVYSADSTATAAGIGLPSKESFATPTGDFKNCIEYGPNDFDYFYATGSMSDKSRRLDGSEMIDAEVMTGPRPTFPITCKKYLPLGATQSSS